MGVWMHQVEMKLDPVAACERLRRMEAWCGEWQLGMRVIETAERGRVEGDGVAGRRGHARSPGFPSNNVSDRYRGSTFDESASGAET